MSMTLFHCLRCLIKFNSVTGDDLGSPALNILSFDPDVSCKQNNFSSYIDPIILRRSTLWSSPMIMIEFGALLYGNFTSYIVVSLDLNIIRGHIIKTCCSQRKSITLLKIKTWLNKKATLSFFSILG